MVPIETCGSRQVAFTLPVQVENHCPASDHPAPSEVDTHKRWSSWIATLGCVNRLQLVKEIIAFSTGVLYWRITASGRYR